MEVVGPGLVVRFFFQQAELAAGLTVRATVRESGEGESEREVGGRFFFFFFPVPPLSASFSIINARLGPLLVSHPLDRIAEGGHGEFVGVAVC